MDIQAIKEWFDRPRNATFVRAGRVTELYYQFHPRTAFLKMLPMDASVVDIGAGDGSLLFFKAWPKPKRADLKLFAYALEKGASFGKFEGYEIGDWNAAPPEFDGRRFDAIVCAHFIEHIAEPDTFVQWAARKLMPGGRLYLEWPSVHSLDLPSQPSLKDAGVPLVISRYDDDCTHQRGIPDRGLICSALRDRGLQIEQEGLIRLPWIEEQLMAKFKNSDDPFPRQAAYWSKTKWSQFVVAAKP